MGLIVFIHLFCFAAIVFSRVYYGEVFNPIVFAQFVEAKKTGLWDPLTPAPAAAIPPSPPASTPSPTLLTTENETPKPTFTDDSTNNWAVLTEEERLLVRARKIQLAQNAMRESEKKWLLGQQQQAIDMLHRAMEDLPDHPPLVRMMAEFYQETGDFSKAGFFWEKVKLLSEEKSADWKAASAALAKLEELERAPGASLGGHKPIGAGKLKIVRVEEERRPLDDLYDFNLRLRITLSANLTESTVNPHDTKVEILFFDQYETAAGVVLPRRSAVVTTRLDRPWNSRQNMTVEAPYSVGRGYWRAKLTAYGKSYDFCGYVVRVYYRGEFQDAAWSRDLLLPQIRPVP